MTIQSAAAGARQLDTEFNDDPDNLTNNGQLGELLELFSGDENQYKEAQAQSRPLRPNIGTDMISARQRVQRNNKFTAAANKDVIELPIQFDPKLLDNGITALHALGEKQHTKRAYDPKLQEFTEFLDYKYPYESIVTRYHVQFTKVYEFIVYHTETTRILM